MAETAQQADRRRQAAAIERLEEELINLHLDSFPTASRPKATPAQAVNVEALRAVFAGEAALPALEQELEPFGSPPKAAAAGPVDHNAVIGEFRKRTLREVPLIRLAERRTAKQEALVAAETAIAEREAERAAAVAAEQSRLDASWEELERVRAEVERQTDAASQREAAERAEAEREEQAELDRQWSLLLANDSSTVEQRLTAVLSDWASGRPPRPRAVTCQGKEALLTIELGQPETLIPEQRADLTAAGRPTVKTRNQTDRNQLYFTVVGSVVLALARCALAAAPGLEQVAVFVVREEEKGKLAGQLAVIYFGRFGREDPGLSSHHPADAVELAADALFNIGGRTDEVSAIDLSDEPNLQAALERVG